MPTNSIKHKMISEARKIANKEYEEKREIQRGLDGSIIGETWYPPTYFMNLDIETILEKHPEFDSREFKRMIKEFQVRNKQSGVENG